MTEYLPGPGPLLRQGDIVLAPSVVLLAGDEAVADPSLPAPPQFGQRRFSWLWQPGAASQVPDVIAETLVAAVLVLSHECHLEKDFNERIRAFMAAGMPRDEAVEAASADPALDPFAVVAPLRPYSSVPANRHAGIRVNDRIGYFALDAVPGDGGDYLVDLGRTCTVSVRLLPKSAKVASLAPDAVAELRFKLAEAYAIRDLSVIAELQAMVGQRIRHAEALPKSKKKSALVLHLENGEIVHLEIRRPRDELPEEITRVPA
jgi:uncharacterized protein YoaH (UPF0181 family)